VIRIVRGVIVPGPAAADGCCFSLSTALWVVVFHLGSLVN
jgi:hypothetical protein